MFQNSENKTEILEKAVALDLREICVMPLYYIHRGSLKRCHFYFCDNANVDGSEPEEEPPAAPGRGASRMLRGLMLRRRAVLGTPKCEKSVGRRGSAAPPRTPLGELTALPKTP